MGKTYWLIFISVTALSSGLVWHYAPTLGKKLPPAVRTRICETFADVQNRIDIVQTGFSEHLGNSTKPSPATTTTSEDVAYAEAPIAVPARTPSAVAPQQPPTTTQQQPQTAAQQRPQTATQEHAPTATRELPSPAQTVEESPYDKGIVRVGPSASSGAKWCVLAHVTPVDGLDGKRIGSVAGGRFFLIESRKKADDGLMLVGNFTPKKLPNTVQVAAKDVICLTGSPDDLSEKQKDGLRMYYQLSGEAETLKTQLVVKESQKNPYAVEAAEALSKLRAKEAEARRQADDADSNRNATYDIAPLAEKVRSLNKRAKEWKEAHASEISDPEKDPAYLKIIKQRKQYAEAIPGLAF